MNQLKNNPAKAAVYENSIEFDFFFLYMGFLSQTFKNHRAAGEGRDHFINFSQPLPPVSQTPRH